MSFSPNKIRMFVVELTFLIKDKKKRKRKIISHLQPIYTKHALAKHAIANGVAE